MENARLEMENETAYEPPPWESLPEGMVSGDSATVDAQQDPQLRKMIATAEDEVRSLRPSSNVYSNSTASIYSSLSRHSKRMSVILDRLPMIELESAPERCKSTHVALTIRDSCWLEATSSVVPIAPQRLSLSRPPPLHSSFFVAAGKQSGGHEDSEKAFKDLGRSLITRSPH